ncbi:hypothetical protein V8C34DRAFT_269123 [Trichoderma compactum]
MQESEDWTVVRPKTRRSGRGHGPGSGSNPFSEPSRAVLNLTNDDWLEIYLSTVTP